MTFDQYTHTTSRTITHRTIDLPVDWLSFTTHLEHRLGRFDAVALDAAHTLAELEAAVNKMRGAEPFSIYAIYDHGVLSTLAGQPRRAKQYVLGNSRVATTMTVHDIRAAQSAPISNLVHERVPGTTTIEFEEAGSMFSGLTEGNEDVTKVGKLIDQLRESVFLKVFDDVQAGRVGGNGL